MIRGGRKNPRPPFQGDIQWYIYTQSIEVTSIGQSEETQSAQNQYTTSVSWPSKPPLSSSPGTSPGCSSMSLDQHFQQFEHGTLDRVRDVVLGPPGSAELLDGFEFSFRDRDRAQAGPLHFTLLQELREHGTFIRVPTRRVVPSGPECDVSNGRKKGAKAKRPPGDAEGIREAILSSGCVDGR